MFAKMLLFSFVLGCVFINVIHAVPRNAVPDGRCTAIGPMCDDCTNIINCSQDENSQWVSESGGSCSGAQTCKNGVCTLDPNPACESDDSKTVFVCRETGIFPNPFKPYIYYICKKDGEGNLEKTPISRKCLNGFCFDPLTAMCRQSPVNNTCAVYANSCDKPVGPIYGNPHMYYICGSMEGQQIVQIYFCPIDNTFNATLRTCVSQTPLETGLDEKGYCAKSGNFYYSPNCQRYNYCARIGVNPVVRSCSTNVYFDPVRRTCSAFTCQILVDY